MQAQKRYNRYYVSGSAAPKIKHRDTFVHKTVNKPVTQSSYLDLKIRMIVLAIVIFIGSGALVYQHSVVAFNQKYIDSINTDIFETEKEINNLKTEIAESMDTKYVEKRATEDLNMIRPKPHQIVYINVKKEGHTVQLK